MDASSDQSPRLFSLAQIQHVLKVEFSRARRYRYPLTLLCLEIDNLGALRTKHGWEGKEQAFTEVVELLQKLMRTSDFLGRLADDRLLVVVPHTDAMGTKTLMERLLGTLRAHRFQGALSSEALTLSIGSACMLDDSTLYHDQLVSAAERALQAAKTAGGNCAVEERLGKSA